MKKIFTAIGILSLTAALALTASAKTYTMGDVDNNTRVTASDARQVLRASASLETLDNIQKIVADIDKNERITASDARAILRISANLEKAPGTVEIGDEASTVISDKPVTETSPESTTIVPDEPATETPVEPTTIVPDEPVTETPVEPTTILPDEPITETPTEPTTTDPNEPITIGPSETTDPIEEGATVAFENFPKQVKAFFSGKFGFEGYSYGSTGKEEMKLKTDGTNYKVGMQMDMGSGMKNYTMMLKPEKKSTKIYMVFEAEKKYLDFDSLKALTALAGGSFNMDDITSGLDFSLNAGNTDNLTAVVTYITEGETTYTIYTVTGANNTKTVIRLIGDEIVRMTILDDAGNISSQMDITKFYSEITDADFSFDGYEELKPRPLHTLEFYSELMDLLS